MDTTTAVRIYLQPIREPSRRRDVRPAWRVRAMLEAVAYARRWQIPYSPFVAVKELSR